LHDEKDLQRGHGTMAELNITPLLDLVFVLLVIFIITTPQLMNNLEMTLPSGKPPPKSGLSEHDLRAGRAPPTGHHQGRPRHRGSGLALNVSAKIR
jgi:hypothetical protein